MTTQTQRPSPPNNLPNLRKDQAKTREKRAKRLCFKCDEKWTNNNECRKKEFSMLIMVDEAEYELVDEDSQVKQREDKNEP